MFQSILNWLSQNYIELTATVSALIYLFLSIRSNIWLWVFGFICSALYVGVFFQNKLYADMGINLYYVGMSIYGWLNWRYFNRNKNNAEKPISRLTVKQILLTVSAVALLTLIIGYYLSNFTDSDVPYPDAFTTAGSILATLYLARKVLEHWLMWVIIDAVSLLLYIYKGLYPTVILFAVYTLMAVVGFYQWRKIYNAQ